MIDPHDVIEKQRKLIKQIRGEAIEFLIKLAFSAAGLYFLWAHGNPVRGLWQGLSDTLAYANPIIFATAYLMGLQVCWLRWKIAQKRIVIALTRVS